jgi:hypothetical protein
MSILALRSQYATEARFAGKIDSFIRQHRHDARRWELSKLRLVSDLHDLLALLSTQCVRRPWSYRLHSAIAAL